MQSDMIVELQQYPLIYLASPYSKYPGGLDAAFKGICETAAILLKRGLHVYSPIAHTHPIALYGNLDPLDHAIWLPFDAAIMGACSAMLIVKMEGWEQSFGIAEEIKVFEAANKPIHYLDVNTEVPFR